MAIAGVHTSGRSSPDTEKLPSTENLIDIEVLNTKFQKSGLAVLSDPMSEVNQIIFNSQMNQKEYERVQEVHIEEICDEEVQLLPTSNRQLRQADPVSCLQFITMYIGLLLISNKPNICIDLFF